MLDNADNADFLLESPVGSSGTQHGLRCIDCIPTCDHGSMLVTTRSISAALKLVDDTEIIKVLPMSVDEAQTLLQGKLGQLELEPEIRLLVQALDCLPLAIAQAAAYIRERRPRCSVRQYHGDIERHRGSRTRLLRRDIPLTNRDKDASNSVLLTWQISFEHIYQTRRSAAELLSLMSFCDRSAIPEMLLRVDTEQVKDFENALTFEEDIVTLRNFSFVNQTAEPHTWEMHRLVQDATQVWLEDRGRLDEVFSQLIHHLDLCFPNSSFETWSVCRKLFTHVRCVADRQPTIPVALPRWASVMYKSASYALAQGDYSNALLMVTTSMVIRSRHFGENSELTLSTLR